MKMFIQLAKIAKFHIVLLSVVWLSSCFDYATYEVANNSRDTVYVYIATGYEVMGPTAYPDTMLPSPKLYIKFDTLSFEYGFKIAPGTKEYFFNLEPTSYRPLALPRDTLSVFFISKDTLQKYGYNNVRENNRILVRYDLSRQEAEMLDFSFAYPPQAIMRNMKMSPPFSWFEEHEVWW